MAAVITMWVRMGVPASWNRIRSGLVVTSYRDWYAVDESPSHSWRMG